MILVNGADGIGTGWSTSIPNFNPRDLIDNIRQKLNGEEAKKMHPHYFGFGGTIESDTNKQGSYIVSGKIERIDDETLHITELPIKSWTQDYKSFLEKMMLGDEKKKLDSEIKDFKENHTDTTVSFTITAKKELIDKFEKEKDGLEGKFKLRSRINTTNMNVFDKHGRIIKFNSPEALLDAFYTVRLHYYGLRKDHLLKDMRRDQRMLSNKARFVEEVCSGELVISNRKRKEILAELKEKDYEIFSKKKDNMRSREESESEEDDETIGNDSDSELAKGYEYLLGMKIWSLTFEKAELLRQELAEKSRAVAELEATSPEQLWMNDLSNLENALDERDEYYAAAAAEEIKAQGKNSKRKAMKLKKSSSKRKAKKKDDDSDEDFELPQRKKNNTKPKTKTSTTTNTKKKKQLKQTTLTQASLTKTIEIDLDSDAKLLVGGGTKDSDERSFSSSNARNSRTDTIQDIGISKSSSLSLDDDDSDSDLEYGSSLQDRLINKKQSTASKSLEVNVTKKTGATKKTTAASKTKKATVKKSSGKKRSSPKQVKDNDEFDLGSYEPAALTPAPKKKKVCSNAQIEIDSDEDDIFDEEDAVTSEVPQKIKSPVSPIPRARSTRGRKKVTYVIDSDEEDDCSDDEFDFDE